MPSEPLRLREIRNTTAFRLTVGLGAVFTLGLLALIGLVYILTVHELDERTDRILRFQASHLLSASPDALPGRMAAELARSSDFTHLSLISADGEKVAGDFAVPQPPPPNHPVEMETPIGLLRILAIRTPHRETILIARDMSQIRHLRARILLILLASGFVILTGLASASVLLATGPLRRVRDLEAAAREIARGRFDLRMPLHGRGDELDQIAGTVNIMVDEIGRVVAQVKGVTDAVAHDLRTPLARVRARLLDIAKLPEAAPLAKRAIDDLDQVLARFQALLRISEFEAGARRAHFEAVDLAALATEAIELYEPLAEERGISLSLAVTGAPAIEGDRHLLLEAIGNLIDNGIKFARAAVTLSVGDGEIAVRDDGGGIPPDERKAALRRFHRGANAEGVPGAGLGLSIVAAIAHLHGLELTLDDAHPGLLASLRAP